jgi:lipopolysaccharide/colanic/teichoic acid biosynthesis glycosyltransferase
MQEADLLFSLSRRHALPFSVVVMGLDERTAAPEGHTRRDRIDVDLPLVAQLEHIARAEVRSTDLLARGGRPGHYVVFCPYTPQEGAKELSRRLRERAGSLSLHVGDSSFQSDALTLPDLIETAWHKAGLSDADALSPEILAVSRSKRVGPGASWRRHLAFGTKRAFDLTLVLGSAPLWLPVLLGVALAVWLSDRSAPVFFVQRRTGRAGRRFPMLKFRTMVPNADELKEKLRHLNRLKWPDFKIDDDPRITRLGRFLRKSSLDELPQLLNVLRGEMSLVGPRPTSFPPESYEPWQTARLDAMPGVTGLWQVEGRTSTEFDERLRLDLKYIENQGFFYDLWLLLRTIPVVLKMRGAQ